MILIQTRNKVWNIPKCCIWRILTKTMFLFVDIKLQKTTEIHIQNICPYVKTNESCQAIWKQIKYFVWPPLTLYTIRKRRGMLRNISPDVHNILDQISNVCLGVDPVISSTLDFRPEVQTRWHIRSVHVLHILIFEEIYDTSCSVFWTIVSLEHNICLEASFNKCKDFGFQDTYVLVLIYASIQYVELGFPSVMEGTSYRDSAAACLYSRKRRFIYVTHKWCQMDWQPNKRALTNWLIAINPSSYHTKILTVDIFESIMYVYAGYGWNVHYIGWIIRLTIVRYISSVFLDCIFSIRLDYHIIK